MLDTNVNVWTIAGQRLFRDWTQLWYRHPPFLVEFGRIPKPVIGTSGGRVPQSPLSAFILYYCTWNQCVVCSTWHDEIVFERFRHIYFGLTNFTVRPVDNINKFTTSTLQTLNIIDIAVTETCITEVWIERTYTRSVIHVSVCRRLHGQTSYVSAYLTIAERCTPTY